MAKPKRLKYTGKVSDRIDERGNVVGRQADRWFEGVPARDLDESDLVAMDAATIKNITGGTDPLYMDPDAENLKVPAKAKARTRKTPVKAPVDPVKASVDVPEKDAEIADANVDGADADAAG